MLNNNQPSKHDMMNRINQVSFAVNDMLLYLDTHPHDQKALDDTRRLVEERQRLLDKYAENFGPLTVDTTSEACSDSWAWVLTPWPWEVDKKKGRC